MTMVDSVTSLLEPIKTQFCPLISADNYTNLYDFCSQLPLQLTGVVAFELHFTERCPTADLLIPISAQGRRILLQSSEPALPRALYSSPVWQRLSRVALSWGEPSSLLHRNLATIWLEFDESMLRGSSPPTPFIFLSLTDTARLSGGCDIDWLFDEAISILLDKKLPSGAHALFRRVIGRLSTPAGVSDVGVPLGRKGNTLRMNIKDLPIDEIADCSKEIGWRGTSRDFVNLSVLLAKLAPLTQTIKLCLDVGDSVGDRLGLECNISLKQRGAGEGWSQVLSLLAKWQLLPEEMIPQLLSYVGVSRSERGSPWPNALRVAEKILDGRYRSIIVRDISHVKVSVGPMGHLEAKVYAYAGYAWRARNSAHVESLAP